MKRYDTFGDKVLVTIIYLILAVLFVIMLYPFWETVILSISNRKEALGSGLHLWTAEPSFEAYKQIFNMNEFWNSMKNSGIRVLLAVVLTVIMTSMTAYPLTKEDLPGKKLITNLYLFTMIFHAGTIPAYLVIKSLGMVNTIWALVIPGCVGAYNLIIMRNFIMGIPGALSESAYIDGATDFQVWLKIILPLSKPVLATIALWTAVNHWNDYMSSLIYIHDQDKYMLSVFLRRILIANETAMVATASGTTSIGVEASEAAQAEITIKSALIMFSILPVAVIYPFLQKYFAKGITLGAVKG